MVRVLSVTKKEHPFRMFFFVGTPERTLTSDLSLRRRLLYTTELLGHYHTVLYRKNTPVSTEKGEKVIKPKEKSGFPLYNGRKLDYNISANESNETRVIPHEY